MTPRIFKENPETNTITTKLPNKTIAVERAIEMYAQKKSQYILSNFTLENLNIVAQDSNYSEQNIDNFIMNNVIVKSKLL